MHTQFRSWSARLVLAAIIAMSAGLSIRWTFIVPIYQAPDEPVHFDYALCLYEHGGLFKANDAAVARQAMQQARFRDYPFIYYLVHPYSLYLCERTEQGTISFNGSAHMPPGYGTSAYYQALDRDAPRVNAAQIKTPPAQAYYYPFGYYGLLALWLRLIHCFSGRLTVLFFTARLMSTALLVVTLWLAHATLGRTGCRSVLALLITACIGMFPLTTMMASSIQPDNLSFTLAALVFYLAVRVRQSPEDWWPMFGLGLALGALFVTKQHYFVAVAVPIVGMLIAVGFNHRYGRWYWLRAMFILASPTALLGGMYYWTICGLDYHPLRTSGLLHGAHGIQKLLVLAEEVRKALLDYYAGVTHDSFWGQFGWMDTPLVIRGVHTMALIRIMIQICVWLIGGLSVIRLEQIGSRVWVVARRRGLGAAGRLMLGSVLLNSYFVFTLLMVILYVRTDNFFAAQGRNWLPFLLPIFMTALAYAPRALCLPAARRWLSRGLAAGLLTFVAAAAYSAPDNIQARFYSADANSPMQEVRLGLTPIMTNQMTWSAGRGDGLGDDPYLIFQLPERHHVHCVRIKFVLDNADHRNCILQSYWMDKRSTSFADPRCTVLYRIRPCAAEQALTIWIDQPIDLFRLDPDMRPCHFELKEMTAMVRPNEWPALRRPQEAMAGLWLQKKLPAH
jgi:hypothetical protein